MLTNILNTGLTKNLDFEDSIRVKSLNVASLLFLSVLIFFIVFHIFYTHKFLVALILFSVSLSIPLIFWFQKTNKHILAKVVFFLLLHLTIFSETMFLSRGRGNEYFYLAVIILVLIQVKNKISLSIIIILNAILIVLPQLIYKPYPLENYSMITVFTVFLSIFFSVRFFIVIQNQYRLRLASQNEKLEDLNTKKNDLMGIVAHDLKSPLAQIKGLVSILELESKKLNQEQISLLEKIKGVAENQKNKISSFLDIKAIEETIENNNVSSFDLRNYIDILIEDMKPLADSKGILLLVNFSSEEINLRASKEHLDKVLANLISNAIKYSYPGSEVNLNITSDDKQVLILVKDQGQGFKKEDLSSVFKKNKVLSATPTANESATGLGLFIVKKYVNMMQGWVWLKSEEGKGATFFVKLPIKMDTNFS